MAGLREAPDQDLVAGLEEDLRTDPASLQCSPHRRERDRRVAGADVEDDCDLVIALMVGCDEISQIGEEFAGQVVDDRVAEILEELRRGRLATAREALSRTTC